MTPEKLDEYLDLVAQLAEADQVLTQTPDTLPSLLPHQVPPLTDPPWTGWLLMGGRGVGKTMAGSRWVADLARSVPHLRARIIAPTLSDAVNGVVADPNSGILAADPSATFRPSGVEGVRVTWPNRSTVWCVGTSTLKDVDRLRALTNIDVDLFEEAAANPQLHNAVTQAALSRRGTRLSAPLWAAMTTPRPLPQIRAWMDDPSVVVTHATTFDNPHTPTSYRDYANSLRGTRAYRQEVLGEVLTDVEGALWSLQDLERSLTSPPPPDDRALTVIGVDPPSGAGTCGIVVVTRSLTTGHLYVLDDASMTDALPHQWATRVAQTVASYPGSLVCAEVNQGGRMVTEVLASADQTIPITTVNATVGKAARAEPVAVLWAATEQRAHFSPPSHSPDRLDALAEQLTEWVPDERSASPDRLDAMVWAVAYHMSRPSHTASLYDPLSAQPTSSRSLPPSPFLRALQSG